MPTFGIEYWDLDGCSNILHALSLVQLDRKVVRNPQRFHTAIRFA